MLRTWIRLCAVAGVFALALPVYAQVKEVPRSQDLVMRGKIVKVESPDRFVVRTSDNKEVILYTSPETRYVIKGKAARYSDLRVGAEIQAPYVVREERHVVSAVTVGAATDTPRASEAVRVSGRIVRVQAPEHVVIRTADNREITLIAGPKSRYVLDGKAGRFSDLRVGLEVNAEYLDRDSKMYVETITVGPVATTEPAPETTVQGTVVRVVGQDQVIVKTTENKEFTVYVVPQTKYVFDDQAGRFTDIRTGNDIRVVYDVRDRRNVARSILGLRRIKN